MGALPCRLCFAYTSLPCSRGGHVAELGCDLLGHPRPCEDWAREAAAGQRGAPPFTGRLKGSVCSQ